MVNKMLRQFSNRFEHGKVCAEIVPEKLSDDQKLGRNLMFIGPCIIVIAEE